MLPHLLTNFEIQKYYQNELIFNGAFSRNSFPKEIKDGAYVISLDEYADVGTHWIPLFCNRNEFFFFGSVGVEHVPEEIKEFIGYFCIGFIDFMLAGKKLTDFTNLFSPHDFKKKGNIILSYFKSE